MIAEVPSFRPFFDVGGWKYGNLYTGDRLTGTLAGDRFNFSSLERAASGNTVRGSFYCSSFGLRYDTPEDPVDPTPPTQEPLLLRQLRIWGDPVMVAYGFDINIVNQQHNTNSNWQNLKLYNTKTGWGAVSNFLHIPREDIDYLRSIQIPDSITYLDGTTRNYDARQKMNWLCSYRGKIYMYDSEDDNWETASRIRWGTTAIGGNMVSIERYEVMRVPNPANTSQMVWLEMARLKGFRKTDRSKPLAQLLSEGIVHRCYCVYRNNQFGDSPRGIVYSPLWSPLDYDFAGTNQPDAFYLPAAWLV